MTLVDVWPTLVSVIIGGSISLVGVWLTNHLSTKARRREREALTAEQRRVFQRNTLTDLNKAITQSMRDTTVMHLADLRVAQQTGTYAGHVLPDATEAGHLARSQELAHLTNLILDDDIRNQVHDLRRRMHAVSRPGPRPPQQGEQEFNHLVDHAETVQAEIAATIRTLWNH